MRLRKIIIPLALAAVFSLMLHRDTYPVKPFDALIAAAGILSRFDGGLRKKFKEFWPKISGYGYLLLLLPIFIVISQFMANAGNPSAIFSRGSLMNYARIIFNAAVFLFLAFIVVAEEKFIKYASIATLVSPAAALPAYWNYTEGVYINGGRLAGFLQSPIIFGMYAAAIYLIGLGLLLRARKPWLKTIIALWLIIIANFALWAASRAAWLGIMVAIATWICFLIRLKKYSAAKLLAASVIISFLAGFALLPHSPQLKIRQWVGNRAAVAVINPLKNQAQTQNWRQTSGVFIAYPLSLGFEHQSPNNIFLEIALDGGIGALVAAIIFFGKILLAIKNSFKHFADEASLVGSQINMLKISWFLAAVTIIISAFFTDGFLLRHVWVVLGISTGVSLGILFPASESRAQKAPNLKPFSQKTAAP